MEVEARHKPIADQGPDDAYGRIADEPETIAAHDLADQPSGGDADKQDDDHALVRKMHGDSLRPNPAPYTSDDGGLKARSDSIIVQLRQWRRGGKFVATGN